MERPEGPLPLPPLGALRAFEAAARHGSFTRAAQELCVTQTAVSHQVRLLEETLGGALFDRHPRRIDLTALGRRWAAALHPVFAALHEANRSLRAPPAPARPGLSITIVPSLASHWLVPRLGRFMAQHPSVDVHLSPSTAVVDMTERRFDLAVRYGAGGYSGVDVERLAGDAWIPVCAPSLPGWRRLKRPSDLARFRLLHDDEDGWARWLEAQGATLDLRRGPLLTDSSMVVDAAVRGQGVGLVRASLSADPLDAGHLVRLFPDVAPLATAFCYYLVRPRERARRTEVEAFCDWLRQEMSALAQCGTPSRRRAGCPRKKR